MSDSITVIAVITAAVSGTIGLFVLFIRSVIDYLNNRDTLRRDEPMVKIEYRIGGPSNRISFTLDSRPANYDWKVIKIEVHKPPNSKCLSLSREANATKPNWTSYINFDPPVQHQQLVMHPDLPEVWLSLICRRTTWKWWEKKRLKPCLYTNHGLWHERNRNN